MRAQPAQPTDANLGLSDRIFGVRSKRPSPRVAGFPPAREACEGMSLRRAHARRASDARDRGLLPAKRGAMLDRRPLAARFAAPRLAWESLVKWFERDPLGTEGAIFTEYLVVVGVCGIVISLAIVMMGTTLTTNYSQNRQIVIAPEP
jgi:hypothetical protein